jgi:hypothetical protein
LNTGRSCRNSRNFASIRKSFAWEDRKRIYVVAQSNYTHRGTPLTE